MKRKRRVGLLVFLLLLLAAIIYVVVRYISYLDDKDPYKTFIMPRLEQSIIEVNSITRDKTELTARMLLDNPLPFKIGADSIAYEFFIGDSSVLKTSYRQSVTLKASDTSWVLIPVTVDNQKLISILERSEKSGFDSVYYEVRGSFYSSLLNGKKFNFRYGRMLPLVHLPDVAITRVEIDSANFNRFKLLIHAKVKNKNEFALDTRDISYRFAVAGNPWVKGMKPGLTHIAADSTTELIFPVTISLEEVGETVFTLLRKGKNIGYAFELNLKIVSEKNMLKNSVVTVISDGTIEEIIDLTKSPKEKRGKKTHSSDR
jgi:LEA14-like dessication related protein